MYLNNLCVSECAKNNVTVAQGASGVSERGVRDEGVRHVSRGAADGRGIARTAHARHHGAYGVRRPQDLPALPPARCGGLASA